MMRTNDVMPMSPLTALSTHSSHKTLGVHKPPAHNGTAAFPALRKKNTAHMKLVSCSMLTPQETWTYCHSIYLLSICYSFPSEAITQQQCLTLQKQTKKAVLLKCEFNQNMPNPIIYSPSDLGGIELCMLYVKQGAAQLQ